MKKENTANKKKKEEKKKPQYTVRQNLRFTFANLWKWDKSVIFMSFLRIPSNVLLPLMGTYMAKYVVDIVTKNESVERLLLYILIFSLSMIALQTVNNIIGTKIQWKAYRNSIKYMTLINEKYLDADYEVIENPENQIKYDKAFSAMSGGTEEVIETFIRTLTNITGFVSYAIIIFTLNPLIIPFLAFLTIGNYFAYSAMHSWNFRNRDERTELDRRLNYLQRSSSDFSRAKDIRLYSMSEWFKNLLNSLLNQRMKWEKKWGVINYSADAVWLVLTLIRDAAAYGYLIYRMLTTGMPVSDFVLYFAVIGGFSDFWLGFVWNIVVVKRVSLGVCDLRDFLDIPDKSNRGEGIGLPTQTCEIEFKNVSFKYPKSESYTIKNQSFKIKKGDKIALVGVNGAGKTTLIKLMCGLYHPAEGEILLNGKNIQEYNRDEYYTLFSAVFQDIHLLPVSIAKNISLQDEDRIDKNRVAKVLKLSGLYDKVNSLEKGEDTFLVKSFNDDAIEFSGGEKQKLALARALYKDGKIIILDEPTAALDPIAESEMYQKYNELTSGRTAVYISHRLSSTRFCDRIFFIQDGEIIETGSHGDLMKKGGKYAEMYDIQSHYYKENINTERSIIENADI